MGVLHPVGPEEPQTYWARRVAVVVALVLLVALIVWLVGNRGGTQAAPPASPEPQPTAPSTPDPQTPDPSATASSSPSADPTSSGSADPGKGKASADADKKGDADKKDKKDTDKKDKKDTDKKTGPTACAPDAIRTTLTGATSAKTNEKQEYALSLINGGKEDCVLTLDADHFELKIYSGTDRIWSTVDCAKQVKAVEKTVKPEQAYEWKMTWNGSRSAEKCAVDKGAIRPGTYVATAQFKGAEPTQHVFTIKG